jgi:hypothetical protein
VTKLVILMGIIIDNQLQMSYLMGDENVYTCYDHMCQHCTLVAT